MDEVRSKRRPSIGADGDNIRKDLLDVKIFKGTGPASSLFLILTAAASLVLFVWIVFLQWSGGGYTAEFIGYPDESAHYVTGLMVHDYLRHLISLEFVSPLKFARDFYDYYPRVSIGHWPPVFYGLQAVWMLLFSPSRLAMMLFMATIALVIAMFLAIWLYREFGWIEATAGAALFVSAPIVQQYTRMIMAELPLALFMILATFSFAHYLRTESWKSSFLFALCASLAIMTKQNGLALALLPPLAVLFTCRFGVLMRFSFWLPALVVAALCGPWYVMTYNMAHAGLESVADAIGVAAGGAHASIAGAAVAGAAGIAIHNAIFIAEIIIGVPLIPFALLGFYVQVIRNWRKRSVPVAWGSMAALIVSIWLFHSFVVPLEEPRHMLYAAPPLIAFAVAGAHAIVNRAVIRAARLATAGVISIMLVLFAIFTFQIRPKVTLGSTAVAKFILSRPELANETLLVTSEGDGEGAIIAELAMLEKRPEHRILRASKVLSDGNFNGSYYKSRCHTSDCILSLLDCYRVKSVIIENRSSHSRFSFSYHLLVRRTLDDSASWADLTPVLKSTADRPVDYTIYEKTTGTMLSSRCRV